MMRVLLAAAILLAVGCAAKVPALPEVQWRDMSEALRILRERAHAVRTSSGTGTITLTRPDGESVRFDAAIVTEPPDRVRLRGWKLSRAIFDLTLTPEGLWLLAPDQPDLRAKVKSAGVGAGQLARNWALLSGTFFDRTDLTISAQPKELIFGAPQDGLTLWCYVDRRTLVPTLYMLQDEHAQVRFALNLEEYRLVDGIPYPHRLRFGSIDGRVDVHLTDVELNTELPPMAFAPPRRAEKIEP